MIVGVRTVNELSVICLKIDLIYYYFFSPNFSLQSNCRYFRALFF